MSKLTIIERIGEWLDDYTAQVAAEESGAISEYKRIKRMRALKKSNRKHLELNQLIAKGGETTMEKFIKVSLVGMGWCQSPSGKIQDNQRFANLIAEHVRRISPLDGHPKELRNIRVSVCDQVDDIHFIDSDQALVIPI